MMPSVMRGAAKFFVAITIVTLGLAPFAQIAYADHVPGDTGTQPTATTPPRDYSAQIRFYRDCMATVGFEFICGAAAGAGGLAQDLYDDPSGTVERIGDSLGNPLCNGEIFTEKALWCLLTYVVGIVYWIASAFLWLASSLFDVVIDLLVVRMGEYVHSSAVEATWKIIRNLINIGLIAGFVAVGISTILQVGYKADQWLAKLVIAALLVNFSFFFAGMMIDAANFVASEIYETQIKEALCAEGSSTSCTASITAGVIELTDIGTLEDLEALAQRSRNLNITGPGEVGSLSYSQGYVLMGLLGISLMLGLTIIFTITAFLLIGRFVALILLLVTSPVGIAGYNIPYIDSYAKKWWAALTSQALFAPVYLLLVAIAFAVSKHIDIGGLAGRSDTGLYAIATRDPEQAVRIFPVLIGYIIILVFMFAALSIARSMSKEAGEFKPIYDWSGWLGRNTAGRFASYFPMSWVPGVKKYIGGADYGDGQAFGSKKDLSFRDYAEDEKKRRDEEKKEREKDRANERYIAELQYRKGKSGPAGAASAQPNQTKLASGQTPPKQKAGNKMGSQVPDGAETGTRAQWYRAGAGQAGEQVKSGIRRIGSAIGLGGNKPPTADEGFKTHEEAQKNAGGGTNTQTPPTTPPQQSAPNTTTLATGSSGAPLPPELQGRLDGAAQTHVGIQLVGQVQGHSDTIAGEMRNAGVAEAIIGSTTQAHNDHLESLRKLREKSANDQEHNERVNAANAALKRIEDRESATMAQISERIGRLQGELSSASRPSGAGGIASTPQDQKVERAQMEIRALEQGLSRIKGAQADRRTAHSLVIGNAKPTTKL